MGNASFTVGNYRKKGNNRDLPLRREGRKPGVPVLLFVSDGTGTPLEERWRAVARHDADGLPDAAVIEPDCPHDIHHLEAGKISAAIKRWPREMDARSG